MYILDVDTLTWQRQITHAPVEEHSPGTRSLHVTTVLLCRSCSFCIAVTCLSCSTNLSTYTHLLLSILQIVMLLKRCPGEASFLIQVRQNPATGREELVVVGGYCSSLLSEMMPYTLDLETMYWRCWPGIREEDKDSVQLPTPRQRMAAMRVTCDWLLVSGGSPTSVGHHPHVSLPAVEAMLTRVHAKGIIALCALSLMPQICKC